MGVVFFPERGGGPPLQTSKRMPFSPKLTQNSVYIISVVKDSIFWQKLFTISDKDSSCVCHK